MAFIVPYVLQVLVYIMRDIKPGWPQPYSFQGLRRLRISSPTVYWRNFEGSKFKDLIHTIFKPYLKGFQNPDLGFVSSDLSLAIYDLRPPAWFSAADRSISLTLKQRSSEVWRLPWKIP